MAGAVPGLAARATVTFSLKASLNGIGSGTGAQLTTNAPLLVTPLRYAVLLFDLITIGRFAADLWIFRNRRWRK